LILETIIRLLHLHQHDVVHARDGATAIEKFRDVCDSVDVALLDCRLNGVNGIDVYREIRAHSGDTRVIFMTGYDEEEIEALHEIRSDSAAVLVRKPFSMPELIETMENMLLDSAAEA